MNKYGGTKIPLITDASKIRLGYREGITKGSSRYGCMVGASIDWEGNYTIDCREHRSCRGCNCILHIDNYESGMSYLIESGIITKGQALAFTLDG